MTRESDFIAALRVIAGDPAARGLLDDAAVLEIGGVRLVLTHDMLVEGVHFLPDDPPEEVAWKLVAVNLSDLAGKGAKPLGAMLGYSLGRDNIWQTGFLRGLDGALRAFGMPLLGGDTVSLPAGAPLTFGLTAVGLGQAHVPSRSGASVGDLLWVTGTLGDAGAGLAIARGEDGPASLLERYRSPFPRLEAGERLAPLVSAMMDVSDGLLIDAGRLGAASGVAVQIDLDQLPLSDAYVHFAGADRKARLAAATAGDDYELLFTAPGAQAQALLDLADRNALPISRIGRIVAGQGLSLKDSGEIVTLPERLGYEHGS